MLPWAATSFYDVKFITIFKFCYVINELNGVLTLVLCANTFKKAIKFEINWLFGLTVNISFKIQYFSPLFVTLSLKLMFFF